MHGLLGYTLIGLTIVAVILILAVVLTAISLFILMQRDKRQVQHSILRNYPFLGRVRYVLEHMGPKIRQYITDSDEEGTPFHRLSYQNIVKAGKYASSLIGFGSKQNFDKDGYFIRNALFPKQTFEMKVDNTQEVLSKTYEAHESLFSRTDKLVTTYLKPWLLRNEDAIVLGKDTCKTPFVLKGQVGMSRMSFGALGENAISALSEGLGMAGGTWMNTGEGGLSKFHLLGNVDIIMQIGPGLNGVRDADGNFSWEKLREKASVPQVKAFEIKLGQGAKIRGGHLDGKKVTPIIAETRGVEPWKTIDSPNRFREFEDIPSLFQFMERIRTETGKPVGIKIVVGGPSSIIELAEYIKSTGVYPDFITVDGGEGGTGATYSEMADSVGLPLKAALPILDKTLTTYGVRDKVKIIASGKLFSADKIAIALAMGADLVNIARAFMISVGCIGTEQCHAGQCPVGVATTNPKLQKALVIEEKRYRVLNYLLTLRQGLFSLAAAAGIDSPKKFDKKHVVFKDKTNIVTPLEKLYRQQDLN